MDFTDPTRMTSSPDIKVTTSNVTVMNGVAKFSGNGYIRTSVALTEAAGGCPVTVRLTYKENKRSRQVRVFKKKTFFFFNIFFFKCILLSQKYIFGNVRDMGPDSSPYGSKM